MYEAVSYLKDCYNGSLRSHVSNMTVNMVSHPQHAFLSAFFCALLQFPADYMIGEEEVDAMKKKMKRRKTEGNEPTTSTTADGEGDGNGGMTPAHVLQGTAHLGAANMAQSQMYDAATVAAQQQLLSHQQHHQQHVQVVQLGAGGLGMAQVGQHGMQPMGLMQGQM